MMQLFYENQKYIHAPFRYWGIKNITRQCDAFTLYDVFGRRRVTDYGTAIKTLVIIYYHFLLSGGRMNRDIAAVRDPSWICLNITNNEMAGGNPVLSAEETKKCLGYLLHGLYCFHNVKCRETDVMYGLAYLIRKLYEPYMKSGIRDVHELYYAIVARGTFVLHMNNRLMARSFYKSMYELWPYAGDRQRYFLGGMSLDAKASYDSVLDHEDISYDPMHDDKKYPWNMYKYNVDNIILTCAAAKEMKDIGEKAGCFSADENKKYGQLMDFIHDFFTTVAAFYKIRCDFYNSRPAKGLKDTDPIEYYGNVKNTMEKYPALEMDLCPYLFFSCELFKSTSDPNTSLYTGIAKHYAGRDYDKLDRGCPIFGGRAVRPGSRRAVSNMLNALTDGAVVISMLLMIANAVLEWQRRTHGLTIIFWVIVLLLFFGVVGAGSN